MAGMAWNSRRAVWVILAGAANFALAALVLWACGSSEEGTKIALRATARVGFLWFALAFSSAPLNELLATRWTKWLLARRRFVGASFAAAFLTHVAMIVWLYHVAPVVDAARPVPLFEVVGGVLGLSVVYALLLTSFDRAAAALGRRRWSILHLYGSIYVMGIFIYCFSESLTHSREELVAQALFGATPAFYYYPFLALASAAVALRLVVLVRRRLRRTARSATVGAQSGAR